MGSWRGKSSPTGIPTHAAPRVTGARGRGEARIKGPRDFLTGEGSVQDLDEGAKGLDLNGENGRMGPVTAKRHLHVMCLHIYKHTRLPFPGLSPMPSFRLMSGPYIQGKNVSPLELLARNHPVCASLVGRRGPGRAGGGASAMTRPLPWKPAARSGAGAEAGAEARAAARPPPAWGSPCEWGGWALGAAGETGPERGRERVRPPSLDRPTRPETTPLSRRRRNREGQELAPESACPASEPRTPARRPDTDGTVRPRPSAARSQPGPGPGPGPGALLRLCGRRRRRHRRLHLCLRLLPRSVRDPSQGPGPSPSPGLARDPANLLPGPGPGPGGPAAGTMLPSSIQISGEPLSGAEVRDICRGLRDNAVRLLSLRGCRLCDRDFGRICRALAGATSLAQLNLNLGVVSSPSRIKQLAEALRTNRSIQSLL